MNSSIDLVYNISAGMETLAWVGLSLSFFSALLIGTKAKSSVSDKILTAWLSFLAIEFLTCALDYKIFRHPLLSNAFLIFNPAFYLYVKALTKRNFKLQWTQLLHLIPYLSFELSTYILKEPLSLGSFIDRESNLIYRGLFGCTSVLSWLIYNALSYRIVRKHRGHLEQEFSNIEKKHRIGWIFFVLIFYSIFCLASFLIGLSSILSREFSNLPHIFVYSTFLLLVIILGYYGLMQKEIYSRITPEVLNVRYKKSLLSGKKKANLKKLILDYFEKEEPYINPDLSMDLLSAQLDVPKHQLTEVLNMEIGKNFFQFVNSYRVEAVKKKLADKSNPYSIEAIGYECGFNSKSSFFTVFKNLAGQTPLQYKNSSGRS
jgi:AraC-like DNA-binding protein